MKVLLAALVLAPAALAAQQHASVSRPVTMEIRSVDSSRVTTVAIDVHGQLFESVGVLRPASGQVECGPSGCVATTPALLELSTRPGEGALTVPQNAAELAVTVREIGRPDRHFVAFGHTITFVRDSAGRLEVRAPRMITRF